MLCSSWSCILFGSPPFSCFWALIIPQSGFPVVHGLVIELSLRNSRLFSFHSLYNIIMVTVWEKWREFLSYFYAIHSEKFGEYYVMRQFEQLIFVIHIAGCQWKETLVIECLDAVRLWMRRYKLLPDNPDVPTGCFCFFFEIIYYDLELSCTSGLFFAGW